MASPDDDNEEDDEPSSLDFLSHLGRRLGVDANAVLRLLGGWLRNYEPEGAPALVDAEPPPRDGADASDGSAGSKR